MGRGLTANDVENFVLKGLGTMCTDALLQNIGALFHACMVKVLLPAGRQRFPIGTTLTHREADVVLSRDHVRQTVDQVITIGPTLALCASGELFRRGGDTNSHISILARSVVSFNHLFSLVLIEK